MTKILHLIIVIIFSPTYLFSETVTLYATQSASYYASGCCSLNSIGYNNSNILSAGDCIYWSYYDACERSTKYPIWSFNFIELSPNDTVLSVSFQAEAVYDEWHDSYMAISSQTGAITTSMGSNLVNGGDWSIDSQIWTWWNQGLNIYQELPVYGVQLAIESGQLNIAVHEYLGSIINYGTNAPRLVIEYESIIVAPTGLQYNIQGSSVMLTWDVLTDADYYKLERSTDSLFIEGVETSYIQDNNYTDDNLEYNIEYFYRVAANIGFWTDYSNVASVIIENVSIVGDNDIPIVYKVHQNHPNPFNPVTMLQYDLPEDGFVNITIYNMMGRQINTLVSGQQNAGYKSIQWNATNNIGQPVSAGLYLYTIQAGNFRQTKKMVLLK